MKKRNKIIIDIDWLIKNYISYFNTHGMTETNIREHFEDKKKDTPNYSGNDYLWYLFQLIATEIPKQVHDEEKVCVYNIEVYSKMWEFLINVEGRNPNHVKRIMHDNELRLMKIRSTAFLTEVEIIAGHCCPFCDSHNGKRLSIEDAIKNKIVASMYCTREQGCNCCYAEIGVRGSDGRLIML